MTKEGGEVPGPPVDTEEWRQEPIGRDEKSGHDDACAALWDEQGNLLRMDCTQACLLRQQNAENS